MSPSAIVRFQARQTLKGNYAAAVGAFIILLLPVFLIMGLNYFLGSLLMLLTSSEILTAIWEIVIVTPVSITVGALLSPLFNGYIRLFYLAALYGEFRIDALFYYFERGRYHRTLHLNLSLIIRLILPGFICFLPVLLYNIICYAFFSDFVGTVPDLDISFILSLLSSILLILYSLKYYLVLTLYCTGEQTDISELFRVSRTVMKDQKQDAAKLFFSFTPWMLLCLLIVPALYVVPYMTQSLCIGAKWMSMKGT